MPLEVATYINQLDSANPAATDVKSQGDDHLRLVKSTIKATFPNVAGAVSASHTQLSYVAGVTSAIQTQLNGKLATNGNAVTATAAQGNAFANTPNASEGQIIAKITGQNDAYLFNNATAWGVYSASGGAIVNYDRATSLATFTGRATNSLGEGQTWQNLTGSRAQGTTYTNTSGRPIMVAAQLTLNAGQICSMVVSSITVDFVANPTSGTLSVTVRTVVPASGTYVVVNSGGSLNTWSELRV